MDTQASFAVKARLGLFLINAFQTGIGLKLFKQIGIFKLICNRKINSLLKKDYLQDYRSLTFILRLQQRYVFAITDRMHLP